MDEVLVQPTLQMRNTWTVGDLRVLELEDWRRYELVDGSLVVSPSATPMHELASEEVRAAIRRALDDVHVVIGPVGVEIGRTFLTPDLVVARRAALPDRVSLLPADVVLAVEVVSPGSQTMDRLVKPAKYAAVGIEHYWRVETDPVGLTAYRLVDGTYAETGTWTADRTVAVTEPFAVELDLTRLLPG